MPTVCNKDNHQSLEFQQADSRKVQAGFDGGHITSDGGAVLLRELAECRGMFKQMTECFTDHRNSARTTHGLEELLTQRVLAIACGYEDLNDHDQLRADPMVGLLAGKSDPDSQPIAGKSTLNRLEQAAPIGSDAGAVAGHNNCSFGCRLVMITLSIGKTIQKAIPYTFFEKLFF